MPVDLASVARMAQRVGELLLDESLELLELNPVLAGPAGTVAVDATARRRVAIAREAPADPSIPRVGTAAVHDLIVIGGGFDGATAAREAALRGRSVLPLEARDRLGGRTWRADWHGSPVEYGGAWVHWHQPHTWSEITRAGPEVAVSDGAQVAGWYVGDERRSGSIEQRDAIARRGWDRFVDGVREALPVRHDPLNALGAIAFSPPLPEGKERAIALGQVSRGIKIFIRARGEAVAHKHRSALPPVRLSRHRVAQRRRLSVAHRIRRGRRALRRRRSARRAAPTRGDPPDYESGLRAGARAAAIAV